MPSQPTNVRIVGNDREARAGTTRSTDFVLRLSGVTLTSEDLDRLAAAIAERMAGAPVAQPSFDDTYVAVRRNTDKRPLSEF